MPDAYYNARRAPQDLASGRVLEPGEVVGADALNLDDGSHDRTLIDDGALAATDLPATEPEGGELRGEALELRARELGVEGRSQMTADELRAAVADAEREADPTPPEEA